MGKTYDCETFGSLSSVDSGKSIGDTLVHLRVCLKKGLGSHIIEEMFFKGYLELSLYLFSAFNNIERANDGVSDTARENTTNHTFRVVAHIMNVASGHFGD